jgi:cephalosporin hydroxylase
MEIVEDMYTYLSRLPSDINEHLPTLYKYATECESVFESGVRGCVSSWALVYGLMRNGKSSRRILLNDISSCPIDKLLSATKDLNIDVKFEWINNLNLTISESVDLTFIDTWHVYGQLKRELAKFAPLTKKYIIMHDTTLDAVYGETIRNGWNAEQQSRDSGIPVEEINRGIWQAVEEFLSEHPEWTIRERLTNNNGLTVLARL